MKSVLGRTAAIGTFLLGTYAGLGITAHGAWKVYKSSTTPFVSKDTLEAYRLEEELSAKTGTDFVKDPPRYIKLLSDYKSLSSREYVARELKSMRDGEDTLRSGIAQIPAGLFLTAVCATLGVRSFSKKK